MREKDKWPSGQREQHSKQKEQHVQGTKAGVRNAGMIARKLMWLEQIDHGGGVEENKEKN